MAKTRGFWLSQMLLVTVLYAAAILLYMNGMHSHLVVKIALITLAAHLIEIPVAFHVLRDRQPQALRLIIATFFFGLLWWIPAKRGLFAVS